MPQIDESPANCCASRACFPKWVKCWEAMAEFGIDFENVGAAPRVDIAELVAAADARGRTLIKRAYADWARFDDRKKGLAEHGVDLIELPAHGKPRKNAADMSASVGCLIARYIIR